MESNNPVFNTKTLERLEVRSFEKSSSMTVNGTVKNTIILLLLTTASSAVAYSIADSDAGRTMALISFVATLVLCFVIVFKKEKAPVLAPVYAVLEGFSLGFITYWANQAHPGVATNALIGTFSVVALMLAMYRAQILQATAKFKMVVGSAMMAILCTYLVDIVLQFFGHPVSFVHQGGVYGILFSVVVVAVAALSLILDFDMITRAVEARMPKWMEWYAAFALLITIIWLYVEILRLLGKARK